MHRRRAREVTADLVDRPELVAGHGERESRVELRDERTVDRVTDTGGVRGERALAGHERELHAQELVELEPPHGRVRVGHRVGTVDPLVRAAAVDEVVRATTRTIERVGEATRANAGERRRDRARKLPGVHLGLPRLRVDRARSLRP